MSTRIPAGYRLVPVTLSPAIRDAIFEGGHMMPVSLWEGIINKIDLVSGHTPAAQELAIRERDEALAKVAKLEAQQISTVPAGWKLVPVKATEAMENAYFKVIDKNMQRVQTDCTFGRYSNFQAAYPELLAAAPPPPAAPAHALTDAEIERMWQDAFHTAYAEVGPVIGNMDAVGMIRPYHFARAIAAHLARKG